MFGSPRIKSLNSVRLSRKQGLVRDRAVVMSSTTNWYFDFATVPSLWILYDQQNWQIQIRDFNLVATTWNTAINRSLQIRIVWYGMVWYACVCVCMYGMGCVCLCVFVSMGKSRANPNICIFLWNLDFNCNNMLCE